MNEPKATVDFETRSTANLRKCGSWKYSLDPTTEILCLAYRVPYWDEGRVELWHPAFDHLGIQESPVSPELTELFQWIQGGGLVEAHSAWFERSIWQNILIPKYGFPLVASDRWRCSAAKAASYALPRNLEDALIAMNLSERKDTEGEAVMKKMTKPRKPLKKERQVWANSHNAGPCVACKGKGTYKRKPCEACSGFGKFLLDADQAPPMPTLWHESIELFNQVWDYCRQDVRVESCLSESLEDLNEAETAMYILDQTINERGFCLDQEAVTAALRLIEQETIELNQELAELTGGKVARASQRQQMIAWFESEGLALLNTQAATIDEELQHDHPVHIHRALEIMRTLGRSSTAKYEAMRAWVAPDGRVRGGLLYHGASTGRWTGSGVQPHNFPKGSIKGFDQNEAWETLKSEDTDEIEEDYGDVMAALSNALRGAIIASPGKRLFVADYASIEARALLWLAEDEEHLEIFRKGEDIYCTMAASIYGYPCSKKDTPKERDLGKVAVLGLGYQMGAPKFRDTAAKAKIDITEEFSQQVVNAYRSEFYLVKQMWADQEEAACYAVENPWELVHCGRMTWVNEETFLYCLLPSGRRLAYPWPEIRQRMTPWGDMKDALTYKGVNPLNHQWQRITGYGGLLVENQTQAVARDLMAESLLRCEQSGIYLPILSVHDEVISEAHPAVGDLRQFEALVAAVPDWAYGLPVAAEGWTGVRYRK